MQVNIRKYNANKTRWNACTAANVNSRIKQYLNTFGLGHAEFHAKIQQRYFCCFPQMNDYSIWRELWIVFKAIHVVLKLTHKEHGLS
jgi:hypothetical protein